MEVELSVDPATVYFKDMKKGEQRLEKVLLKNTSQHALQISSIDIHDQSIKVDLINNASNWPIELESNKSMELLVSFRYATDNTRFSNQIKINYSGGEANEAFFRVYATQEPPPQPPTKQTETRSQHLIDPKKDLSPVSAKPDPSDKPDIQAPAKIPLDTKLKEEIQKHHE